MRHYLRLLAMAVFLMTGLNATAQISAEPLKKKPVRCFTVERIEELRKLNPTAETDAQFEAWLNKETKNRKQSALRPSVNYTIPVVFHIIHSGEAVGSEINLSAAMVTQQLLQLNKDFANLSNSQYSVAAATGIQFVLAQKDPFSNTLAEPGIDRINRNDFVWNSYDDGWSTSYIDNTVKPISIWDANKYLNIWVIPALVNGTTEILGYSTFPASSTLAGLNNLETSNTAGIAIMTSTVGSTFIPNTCSGYGQGKTLAHEAGHFFGLRHIWGDTDCGNDFCGDTPVHFEANNGVPTHPKSNSCGAADEMFENYMDYSDDVVLNTFTQNQVDRIQTVMLNSPRRLTLTTSNVGQVPVTGTNRISFINCTEILAVSEAGVNANYPRYKDVSLTLNVEDKATGAATVTVTVGGTALSGTHYQLLTPTLNFVAGDKFKPVNIRVFDNARVDGDRTIILSYTISGAGVTAGTTFQTITVTIFDDDNMRVGENSINLVNETFDGPGAGTGWSSLTSSGYPNFFVLSANGDAGGSGSAAHITNNNTSRPNTYTKGVAGAAILRSPVIDASSVLSLGNLSFTYKVAGLVDNDETYLTYVSAAANTGPFYFYGDNDGLTGFGPYSSNFVPVTNAPVIPAPSALTNSKFHLTFYWRTSTDATGSDPGFNVDNIVLAATPFHIETAVGSSYTFDLVSGSNINNFKSSNNKAIATIRNLSQNVSGLTARVTQAGSGSVPVITSGGSYVRTQKVFQISPTVANTTATYQCTLYFTNAELAVWGGDKLNLKILKVKDGVSLTSVLNSSNTEIITPTVIEDAAAGYIAYTATFTGFSQFMLASPLVALPVNLVSFQATALQKNIELVWSTSQELNNRGFMVERSTDANTYEQIGWVNGNGTTGNTSTYSYIDNYVQRNITYYYRLRQVDIDNRQVYSQVRNARLKPGDGISIAVSPNPAKNVANLFISGTTNKATVVLINAAGQQLLQRNDVNTFNGAYNLPVRGLAKGTYTLVVYLPEGAFTKQIILE